MFSKRENQIKEDIEKKKISPLKVKDFENDTQTKSKKNGIIYISYKLDKHFLKDDKYIILFREEFAEKHKNKCKIIINGKEYNIVTEIDIEKLEKYNINGKIETLEVILKLEEIDDMSHMFANCRSLIKVDFSLFNTEKKRIFHICSLVVKI